jgi:hypothetical protein
MQIDSSSAVHRLVALLSHNAFFGGFEREQKYIVHRFFFKLRNIDRYFYFYLWVDLSCRQPRKQWKKIPPNVIFFFGFERERKIHDAAQFFSKIWITQYDRYFDFYLWVDLSQRFSPFHKGKWGSSQSYFFVSVAIMFCFALTRCASIHLSYNFLI